MTARKYMKRLGGFTLVELLIVIALLGVIAMIVIAAINPIEQTNRAKDTGQKADASQFLSAVERYFASREEFPWVTSGAVADNDAAFGFVSATSADVGICSAAGCGVGDADGILITTEELKPEFKNRTFIQKDTPSKQLVVGKADQSQSVYVCYIPSSKSNRAKACADGIVYTLSDTSGSRVSYDCSAAEPASWVGTGITDSYYICVPQ